MYSKTIGSLCPRAFALCADQGRLLLFTKGRKLYVAFHLLSLSRIYGSEKFFEGTFNSNQPYFVLTNALA